MAPKPKEVSVELLEERIRRDGVVKAGGVLKVDAFLNHQMDIELFSQMAEEWKRLFAGKPINKILTIEASGIGIAAVVAHHFGVPVVFAKKTQSINLDGTMYSTRIQSFTHNRIYDVIVSTRFLGPDDHVLIIDDFLANGCALRGLLEICESAGATVATSCARQVTTCSRSPSSRPWIPLPAPSSSAHEPQEKRGKRGRRGFHRPEDEGALVP